MFLLDTAVLHIVEYGHAIFMSRRPVVLVALIVPLLVVAVVIMIVRGGQIGDQAAVAGGA